MNATLPEGLLRNIDAPSSNGAPGAAADVIVVGGGPAGASTAWFLARAGCNVLLFDRARFPRAKACSEYVSPEGARLLDAMGVLSRIDALSAQGKSSALTGMTVHTPSGARIQGEFSSTHAFHGYRDHGIGCRRELLDALILDAARAAGVTVREQVRVEALLRDSDGWVNGVCARTASGAVEEFRAHLVVGADGLRSIVARRLGLARHARWPRRIAIVTHYADVSGVTSNGEMHVFDDGYLGIASVARDIANVALVVPARMLKDDGGMNGDSRAYLEAWIAAHPSLSERFSDATLVDAVRVTGPFASRARRAWAPGAVLVGDAADFFDPFTGEGIYAALRGGELAAPFIVAALHARRGRNTRNAIRVLRHYESARQQQFGGKWRVERTIGAAVAAPALMQFGAKLMARDREYRDLLVGVTGDFVPASELVRPRRLFRLLRSYFGA